MAVQRNPDWSVWLADVWHWARQPPGLYIVIISLMACALLYAFSPQRQPLVMQTPLPTQRPTQLQTTGCPLGTFWVDETKRCIAASSPDNALNKEIQRLEAAGARAPFHQCPPYHQWDDDEGACVSQRVMLDAACVRQGGLPDPNGYCRK